MSFRNANLTTVPDEKPAHTIPYVNVAFSGAGVNGAAHVGAIKAIQTDLGGSLQPLQRIAGTSAGAIAAMLVAVNCSAEQIEDLFLQIDFQKIADGHNILNELINLERQESKFDGLELRKTIITLLKKSCGNPNITFGELAALGYKDLHIMTTRVGKRFGEGTTEPKIFCAADTPHTKILPTVLASASIPGAFPPVLMKEVADGEFVVVTDPNPDDADIIQYCDGGAKHNLPLHVFDKKKYLSSFKATDTDGETHCFNPETIGIMICSPAEAAGPTKMTGLPPHQPLTYALALINGAFFGTQDTAFWHSRDRLRTALVSNNNISSTNFDITREQEQLDISSGNKTLTAFLAERKNLFNASDNVVTLSSFGKQQWQVPSSPVFGGNRKKSLTEPLLNQAGTAADEEAEAKAGSKCCHIM
jgi:NTE family protein